MNLHPAPSARRQGIKSGGPGFLPNLDDNQDVSPATHGRHEPVLDVAPLRHGQALEHWPFDPKAVVNVSGRSRRCCTLVSPVLGPAQGTS